MLITSVEIRNIKNHAESVYEFNPGVTAICGPNGSGKTTIIEAIAWVLFDHLDYSREDFVKRGSKRGQVVVTIQSDLDQRSYQIHRDTGGGYFVFDVDTRLRLVEQKKDVISWLRLHHGVEPGTDLPTVFKSTIGVPQGTFTSAFLLAPSPRKKVFDEILRVEEYRTAAESLKDTQKIFDKRLSDLDKRIAEAEGELRQYDQLKQRHTETELQIQKLETSIAEFTSGKEKAATENASLEILRTGIADLTREIENTRIREEVTSGNLASAADAAEQSRVAAAKVAEAEPGHRAYQEASGLLHSFEEKRIAREALRSSIARLESQIAAIDADCSSAFARLREIDIARREADELRNPASLQEQLEAELEALRERKSALAGKQHSVSILKDELGLLRQRFLTISGEIKNLEAISDNSEPVEELENQLRTVSEQLTEIQLVLKTVGQKQQQLAAARKQLQKLSSELSDANSEVHRLEPLLITLASLAELELSLHTKTEQTSRLRAELARDAEMIAALETGGVCPLLTEKCLNLKPGESLDSRFKSGLKARQSELAIAESVLRELGEQIARLRGLQSELGRLESLRTLALSLSERKSELDKQVSILESEIDAARISETQLAELELTRKSIADRLTAARRAEAARSQLEASRRQMEQVEIEGKEKKQKQEDIEAELKQQPDIDRAFEQKKLEINALGDPRSRIASLQITIRREAEWRRTFEAKTAEKELKASQLSQFQVQIADFALLDEQIAEANRSRGVNEAAYQAYISNLQLASSLSQREAEAEGLRLQLAELQSLLKSSEAKYNQLQSKYDPARHRAVLVELQNYADQLARAETFFDEARKSQIELATQLERLESVRARRSKDLGARTRNERLLEVTGFIRDTLQKAAPFVTETYLHTVTVEANQLFREVTGRYDLSLRWERDYEIVVEEAGHSRPFANLSGGEQMAAALAVRLALMRQFSETLGFAFFDEPTTNMDEDRRRNLAQQIGRVTGFRQLFVISHDDSFENFTDQVISVGEQQ